MAGGPQTCRKDPNSKSPKVGIGGNEGNVHVEAPSNRKYARAAGTSRCGTKLSILRLA